MAAVHPAFVVQDEETGQTVAVADEVIPEAPARTPLSFKQRFCNCLRSACACLIALILLCIVCLCVPCICCFVWRNSGRVVVLDGLKPPSEEEAQKRVKDKIDSARAGSFSARLESALNKSLSAVTLGNASMDNTSDLQEVANDASVKRQMLKQARLASFREASQKLPWRLVIRVERNNALQQSLTCLGFARSHDLLAQSLSINFHGEQALDAGGVTRDWFDSLGQSISSEAEKGDGYFMVLPDGTLRPRPYETRFDALYSVGRLLGLALWYEIPLPMPLGSVACKFLLDVPIGSEDLQRLDPDFVQFRVNPLLRPEGVKELEEALGEPLTFMSAATELRESKELCPDGENKRVTEENKGEYLRLLCEHHLCGDMQEQIQVLVEGFRDIFPKDILACSGISHRELALLISGFPELDVDDWRRNTALNSTGSDELIEWFWEMVKEMTTEERAKLLHFATGSSRLPASGFAGMRPPFNVSVQGDEREHLPHAHTCGNQLVLPRYESKDQLTEKMKVALANDAGFGLA
eukprot:TRINITY_DN104700_c0_g1_i1.p1 TRINITY_DN104700_c0_g1~~TRINITY_DN104700_c0_g1_i1.p1  ORF type:complete len:525 (+),score=95.40 TRINITY_DN104700_c0_g1_i1:135-1709(+)